jgi:hypothetical protein
VSDVSLERIFLLQVKEDVIISMDCFTQENAGRDVTMTLIFILEMLVCGSSRFHVDGADRFNSG